MSHEVEKMMFTGKRPWWFGNSYQGEAIGVYMGEEAVDTETAIVRAGLDWKANRQESAWFDKEKGLWVPVPNEFFIIRDEDGSVLGRCGSKWIEFQNRQAFKFLDSLVQGGDIKIHTAGSLAGGSKVWILAQLPGSFQVGRLSGTTNTHLAFLLIIIGHDGVSAINLMPTDVRAECANTCGFAEMGAQAKGLHWSIAHTAAAEAKLRLAAAALSEIPAAMAARQELLQALAEDKMSRSEFIDFAVSIFLDIQDENPEAVEERVAKWYEDATDRSKTMLENKVAEVTKLFLAGEGAEGNSSYDAVTAFTEHFDHKAIQEEIAGKLSKAQKVARVQGVVQSSWIGAGAKRKALVLKRLRDGRVERSRR